MGTVSSAQQKMDLAAWTLFVTGALCSCIDAVIVIWKYLPRRPEAWGLGDFSDSVLILGRVPETFMLLALCLYRPWGFLKFFAYKKPKRILKMLFRV